MSSPLSPTRLIGNLAALGLVPIAGAFIWDRVFAPMFGFAPTALCAVLSPVIQVAGSIGVLLTTLGFVIWALSRFRSEAAVALIVGGVLLFVAPTVFPHYLGAGNVVCR